MIAPCRPSLCLALTRCEGAGAGSLPLFLLLLVLDMNLDRQTAAIRHVLEVISVNHTMQ